MVCQRFSPQEQHGCAAGGATNVIASLLAGAEAGSDSQDSSALSDYQRECQLGAQQESVIEQWTKAVGVWTDGVDEQLPKVLGEQIAEGGRLFLGGTEHYNSPNLLPRIFDFYHFSLYLCKSLAENVKMKSDIRQELLELQVLQGIDFVRQLKLIVSRKEFRPLDTEPEIFLVGGKDDADYPRLLDAARKAVALGYRVYMLPNPHGIRTADFIFERKGVYRMYDLKTVHGKSSVDTQLLDSIGQANRILLNMTSDYNPRTLAKDIRRYFERNANAVEVLIMKGARTISVIREDTLGQSYIRNFMMKYRQK